MTYVVTRDSGAPNKKIGRPVDALSVEIRRSLLEGGWCRIKTQTGSTAEFERLRQRVADSARVVKRKYQTTKVVEPDGSYLCFQGQPKR